MTEPLVQLSHLSRRFGEVQAVDDVSLDLHAGETVALLGPSGSGKTTLLRLLAGFEQPDAGRVIVSGEDITGRTPAQRRFGMVFQHYALFPHLSVGGNVAFGLETLGLAPAVIGQRVQEALTLVDLEGMENRRITQLSGGQQQRVAVARALAPEPQVLLLDEPLSNLDPALRVRTRRELAALIHRIGITSVFVTHEQDEAFDLGDRVAVLDRGRLRQVATPEELYDRPADAFVASFIGRSSALNVTVRGSHGDDLIVGIGEQQWRLPIAAQARGLTGDATVLIRPDAVFLRAPQPGDLLGVVTDRRFGGASWLYAVELDGRAALEVSAPAGAARIGETVGLAPSRRGGTGLHLYPAATE